MKKTFFALAAAASLLGAGLFLRPRSAPPPRPDSLRAAKSVTRAFRNRLSNLQVSGSGRVIRILKDDTRGRRHQRFILRLVTGQTLLVAHNIDLAPRITGLKVGDTVEFTGEYEWNPDGGLVHWTHHRLSGRHPGGWLRHNGRLYR